VRGSDDLLDLRDLAALEDDAKAQFYTVGVHVGHDGHVDGVVGFGHGVIAQVAVVAHVLYAVVVAVVCVVDPDFFAFGGGDMVAARVGVAECEEDHVGRVTDIDDTSPDFSLGVGIKGFENTRTLSEAFFEGVAANEEPERGKEKEKT